MSTGSNVFGKGMGLGDQLGMTLAHQQVTAQMIHQANADPIRGKVVGAAFRGEIIVRAGFSDVLTRELNLTKTYCEIAGLSAPNNDVIEKALHQVKAKYGFVTPNDRFIVGGLGLSELFEFFYRFNNLQRKGGRPTLKLSHDYNEEWWRTDKYTQHFPTKPGVFSWKLEDTMQATDLAGRPFNLDADEQDVWTKEYGGKGRASVEQITYLFQRCLLETGLPMWGFGAVRALNNYGLNYDKSLYACYNATRGFYVDSCNCSNQCPDLAAIPEVFQELVP